MAVVEVALRLAEILDRRSVPYALGGSLAGSFYGIARSTVDVDLAIDIPPGAGRGLIEELKASFYVPEQAASVAIETAGSFNLLGVGPEKADLFVLGSSLLDRWQIERRVRMELPLREGVLWVTAPGDLVLRKLDWYRASGGSERQWSDVEAIVASSSELIDLDRLRADAAVLGLDDLLARILSG